MQIKSAKVSNILSFSYIENIAVAPPTIEFGSAPNILIGPNGSGKSNLIEAISKILQSYFYREFNFEENAMAKINPNNKPIKFQGGRKNGTYNILTKHRENLDKESKILLTLEFDANDISNFNFLLDNLDDLKEIANEYAQNGTLFNNEIDKIEKFDQPFEITFEFEIHNPPNQQVNLAVNRYALSKSEIFVHAVMQDFNLLQKLIEIGISIQSKPWTELKTTFALIGSLRNHDGFPSQIEITPGSGNQLNNIYQEAVNSSTKMPISTTGVFQLTFMKIAQYIKINRDLVGVSPSVFIEEMQTKGENRPLAKVKLS